MILETVDLRARIKQIQQQISALREEQKAAQLALDSVVYPVLTLPLEITSHIFVQYLDKEPKKPNSLEPPLVLTHVCSEWRNIALNLPQLWSHLQLVFDDSRVPSRALVEAWMARIGSTQISMDIKYICPRPSPEFTHPPLLREMLHHSSSLQWKNLTLSLPLLCLASEFSAKKEFPSLESLALICTNTGGSPSIVFPDDFRAKAFSKAPKLRAVRIDVGMPPKISFRLPWSQLTHLDAAHFTSTVWYNVLRLASALVECAFRHIPDSPLYDFPPLHLEHLEVLTISGSVQAISDYLHLPKLRQLNLDERFDKIAEASSDHPAFISRAPELAQFVCHADSETSESWYYASSLVPMLKTTKLTHLELSPLLYDDAERIIRSLRSASFLPQVQRITLIVTYYPGIEIARSIYTETTRSIYDEIAVALAERWDPPPGVVALESFSLLWQIKFPESPEEDSIDPALYDVGERLLELKQKGMDLHVGFTHGGSWL
ncbi:hypothetical protein B0H11DRAFT_2192777 [Mycena galericulata]|nr:hypothetical protein B0H11DRAFT_2192777 [Mycena galericulata]